MTTHVLERFQSKINKNPESGCWEWIARLNQHGYGIFVIGHSRAFLAHRVAFEHYHRPLAEGERVLHKCDNPKCVNPDHLFPGSQADNVRDMMTKGRNVAVPKFGESNPQAKLSAAQVEDIRAKYRPRLVTLKALAQEHGVSVATVHCVIKRKRWAK